MITAPTVTLWGKTYITGDLLEVLDADDDNVPYVPYDADHLAEAAGRACYQSFSRPSEATDTTAKYLQHILDVKHYSVLAHASATFYIEGVSRSLTHELVRHRFLAFSQLSQRFVSDKDLDWVCPPLAIGDEQMQQNLGNLFRICRAEYVTQVELYVARHRETFASGTLLRKRAREAARAVLPNCTETRIVVSGNMRAWRDFLEQRLVEGADLEIRRLAFELLDQLKDIAPSTFTDIVARFPRPKVVADSEF